MYLRTHDLKKADNDYIEIYLDKKTQEFFIKVNYKLNRFTYYGRDKVFLSIIWDKAKELGYEVDNTKAQFTTRASTIRELIALFEDEYGATPERLAPDNIEKKLPKFWDEKKGAMYAHLMPHTDDFDKPGTVAEAV